MAVEPTPWMIFPFGMLLLAIALGPLALPAWWHKHYPEVAGVLAMVTLVYYVFGLGAIDRVLHVAHEYVSFIALIGSLFVVSGGIHINVKGEASPLVNTFFLLIGAVLANVLGTTGASMLLIRPWIRMNKYRITAHHIVFFIFIVSNVGGCLTPIGDPPLFLGFLKGIPFWWVAEHCWPMWLVGVGLLLGIFFVVDTQNYRRAPRGVREMQTAREEWRFEGLANVLFLGVILAAVFVEHPHFLRETIMVATAIGSYAVTRRDIYAANQFNFEPIREVAILFVGIFATMMPALDWLQGHSGVIGEPSTSVFYWGTGGLSSVLDNAPTYLSFLSVILGTSIDPDIIAQVEHLVQNGGADLASVSEPARQTFLMLQKHHLSEVVSKVVGMEHIKLEYLLIDPVFNQFIVATSVGAVFFGAFTYIGNGPNFMVKAIADQQRIHTPTFLGYVFRFAVPILLPVLIVVWLIFFRG